MWMFCYHSAIGEVIVVDRETIERIERRAVEFEYFLRECGFREPEWNEGASMKKISERFKAEIDAERAFALEAAAAIAEEHNCDQDGVALMRALRTDSDD